MKKQKQTKSKPKQAPIFPDKWTRESAADVWDVQAESIRKAKYDKKETPDFLYDLYDANIRDLLKRTVANLHIQLCPEPPTLIVGELDEALTRLAAYCRDKARALRSKPEDIKKYPKAILEKTAEYFKDRAANIKKHIDHFAYNQNDPEISRLYFLYRQATKDLNDETKREHPNSADLPDMPVLIGNDYYAGLMRLFEYNEQAAKLLPSATTKPKNGIALEDDEIVTLRFFCDTWPEVRYAKDVLRLVFPSTNPRSERTVYRILTSLTKKNLLERPANKTKGYIASDLGREYYAEHFS